MSTTARIKSKLKRQSTWSGIGLVALALTPVFPAYAAYLSGHTMVLDGANWLRRYGLGMPEFEVVRDRFDRLRKEQSDRDKADS